MLSAKRIYVGYKSCRVEEEISVRRCHNYAFGHMADRCGRGKTCRKCCTKGHVISDCNRELSCGNCRMAGLPAGHQVMSLQCLVYLAVAGKEISRIQYD